MAKLSELLVATLATAALVACGEDSATKDSVDQDSGSNTGGTPVDGDSGVGGGGGPVGGTPEPGGNGGTPVPGGNGGTPVIGGEGGAGGGGEGGTELPPPAEGCQDDDGVCTPGGPTQPICDAEPCTWEAAGDWTPAGRVNWINVPKDAACAAEAGCRLVGTQNGTALAGLLPLLNQDAPPPPAGEDCPDSGLSQFVQPDETGDIQLVLLARLLGVDGAFAADADADLQLFTGDMGAAPGEWTIDDASFVAGTQDPLIHFPMSSIAEDGRIRTPRSRFALSLPVAGLQISLSLEAAQVSGFVGIGTGGTGFKLTNGLVGGYLTRDSIVALIAGLQASCAEPDPPSFCAQLNTIIPPGSCTPENCDLGIQIITGFLGNFEAKVGGDGSVTECNPQDPADCNAIGVCLQAEMEGATITGISPAN